MIKKIKKEKGFLNQCSKEQKFSISSAFCTNSEWDTKPENSRFNQEVHPLLT